MIRLFTFISIFFVAGHSAADSADPLPDGVEIPRLSAGQPDYTGWYPAVSQTKRFQIHFPVPYDEWSATLDDTQSTTHNLSATSLEDIKFLATEFVRSDEHEFSSAMRLTEAFTQNKRRVYSRNLRHENLEGTQFKIASGKSATVFRLLMTEQYVYLLSVEYPVEHRTSATRLATLFFNSFTLERL